MDASQQNPFGITREEILNLAAQKLVDQYGDESELSSSVSTQLSKRIENAVATTLNSKIDIFLSAEMEKLINKELIPVDLWGDKIGTPTTIRAALYKRAEGFWHESVNADGKATTFSYSSIPRHEFLFRRLVGEAFETAIKQNIVDVLGALKDAIRDDARNNIDKALSELLRVKSLKEQKP